MGLTKQRFTEVEHPYVRLRRNESCAVTKWLEVPKEGNAVNPKTEWTKEEAISAIRECSKVEVSQLLEIIF